jgi:hypothetical protein
VNFGHPAGGQYVEVTELGSTTGGFTGSHANRIVAFFDTPSVSAPMTLRYYDVPVAIPTSLRLPCSGTGILHFVPEPTAKNARADNVTVSFLPGPAVGP